MSETIDPVTSLIEALKKTAPAPPPTGTDSDRLSEAAESIPGRAETAVADLMDSPELQAFRRAYVSGVVEAHVINQVLDLVRAVLIARGVL
jgi:hypothetical protein